MNHKRGRPKNRRSGCLMCKYWKVNGAKRKHATRQTRRADEYWQASRTELTFTLRGGIAQ